MTSPSLTSSGAGRSRSPRASKSTTPPPPSRPPYPAAIWPSGPKATLVTSPSLTSSGVGRSRSPRASKSTTPPPPPPPPYPAAIWPSGPKATLVTSPSLTSSARVGAARPGVEEHHAAAAAAAISRGDLALRPEGHARDIALLDLQRRGRSRSPTGVEEHHAAAAADAAYPAAILPSGPKATLVTLPSLTSSGAGRSRSPRASKSTTPPPPPRAYPAAILPSGPKATLVTYALLDLQRRGSEPLAPGVEEHHAAAAVEAISRGDPALRPEGHAHDLALDLQRRGSEPLATGVEEHHHAADAISRGDLALRSEGHARDRALGDVEEANDFRTRSRESVAGSPELRGCLSPRRLPRPATSQGRAVPASPYSERRQPTGLRDPVLGHCYFGRFFLGEPRMFLSFPRLSKLTPPLFLLGYAAFLGPAAGCEQGRFVFLQGAHPGKALVDGPRSTRSSTGSVGWPFQVAVRPSRTWRARWARPGEIGTAREAAAPACRGSVGRLWCHPRPPYVSQQNDSGRLREGHREGSAG